MRKVLAAATLVAAFGIVGSGPALAGGGMGDPSVHMREMNALCDLQRLGRAPPSPSACLPEEPIGPEMHGHDLNHQRY